MEFRVRGLRNWKENGNYRLLQGSMTSFPTSNQEVTPKAKRKLWSYCLDGREDINRSLTRRFNNEENRGHDMVGVLLNGTCIFTWTSIAGKMIAPNPQN